MSGIEIVTIAPGTPEHPRNDSASVVELSDGRLFLTWMEFVRSKLQGNDEAPNRIAAMTSRDGGRTWGDHRILAEPLPGAVNVYDPSVLRLPNGDILLSFFHYTHLVWQEPVTSIGYICRSRDDAATFSTPSLLWEERAVHSANNAFTLLSTGRIVRAIGTTDIWGGPNDHHRVSCMYSDDGGEKWTFSDSFVHLPLRGAAEGHIAEAADGRLLMAMRTQIGSVFVAQSLDKGQTWQQAQTSGLMSPESMPVLVRIPTTGDLLMIWNHSPYLFNPKFDHFGKRSPLSSAVSKDCGRTWTNIKNIESDPNYEFSNPACNFFAGDKAIVTYFASKMDNPNPPGRCGRGAMSLKGAIVDIDWFYDA